MDMYTVKRMQTLFNRRLREYTDLRNFIHLSKTDILVMMCFTDQSSRAQHDGSFETFLKSLYRSEFSIARQNMISSIPRMISYGVVDTKIVDDDKIAVNTARLEKIYTIYKKVPKLFRVTSARETDYLRWLLNLDKPCLRIPTQTLSRADVISLKTKETFTCEIDGNEVVLTATPEVLEHKQEYLEVEKEIRHWQQQRLIAGTLAIELESKNK